MDPSSWNDVSYLRNGNKKPVTEISGEAWVYTVGDLLRQPLMASLDDTFHSFEYYTQSIHSISTHIPPGKTQYPKGLAHNKKVLAFMVKEQGSGEMLRDNSPLWSQVNDEVLVLVPEEGKTPAWALWAREYHHTLRADLPESTEPWEKIETTVVKSVIEWIDDERTAKIFQEQPGLGWYCLHSIHSGARRQAEEFEKRTRVMRYYEFQAQSMLERVDR